MYQKSSADWSKYLDFMLGDLVALQLSLFIAYAIRFSGRSLSYLYGNYTSLIVFLSLIQIIASLALNSHHNVFRREWLEELISVGLLAFSMLAGIAIYMYSSHTAGRYSRLLVFYTVIFFVALDFLFRSVWKKTAGKKIRSRSTRDSRSLLIVTEKSAASEILKDLCRDDLDSFKIVGLVFTDSNDTTPVSGIDVVSSVADAPDFICRNWVDELLVYLPDGSAQPKELVRACAEMGVSVHSVLNLQNVDRHKQFVENIGSHTVLTTAYNYIAPYQALIKRLMDIAGGLVGSFFAILILIFVGPIIYINSPGPVIFRQERIGKNGKRFTLLKLRSMYLDADERKKEFMDSNRVGSGMMFKLDFDPRIIGNKVLPDGTRKTGIGDFIRKTSLDEFPQFFNVLKGDMSLVGTRPPTVDEWEKYEYHHRSRLAVKPGITGMWQVSGRSKITDFEEVVRLDTEYICKFRISLDIKILFKTIAVLFSRDSGAM